MPKSQILSIGIPEDLLLPRLNELTRTDSIIVDNVSKIQDVQTINNDEITGILVSIYEPLSAAMLQQFKNLKYVGVLGTSLKKIDLDYCQKHHIHVDYVPHYCDEETGEWVIGQIINFFRGIGRYEKKASHSVFEKTLGLIGVGAVGAHVLRVARALGMNVLYHARSKKPELDSAHVRFAKKDEVFRDADVISFHTPPHTSWLSLQELSLLKKDALIINTAMGKVDIADDLSVFLEQRPDISLVMDAVAFKNYLMLKGRCYGEDKSAYLTIESSARLKEKFFANLQSFFSRPDH